MLELLERPRGRGSVEDDEVVMLEHDVQPQDHIKCAAAVEAREVELVDLAPDELERLGAVALRVARERVDSALDPADVEVL